MPDKKSAMIRRLSRDLGVGPRRGATGLILATGVLAVISALGFWMIAPTGPVERFNAHVTSVSSRAAKTGVNFYARVESPEVFGPVEVRVLPPCSVGDQIAVVQSQTRMGVRSLAELSLCKPPPR